MVDNPAVQVSTFSYNGLTEPHTMQSGHSYEVEVLEGTERGIRVSCPDHEEAEEYQPGRRRVAFYCSGCGFELEVSLHDPHDWRAWDERC